MTDGADVDMPLCLLKGLFICCCSGVQSLGHSCQGHQTHQMVSSQVDHFKKERGWAFG